MTTDVWSAILALADKLRPGTMSGLRATRIVMRRLPRDLRSMIANWGGRSLTQGSATFYLTSPRRQAYRRAITIIAVTTIAPTTPRSRAKLEIFAMCSPR